MIYYIMIYSGILKSFIYIWHHLAIFAAPQPPFIKCRRVRRPFQKDLQTPLRCEPWPGSCFLCFAPSLWSVFFCVLQASLQRAGSCLDKCNINAKYCDFMISLPRCPHCLIQHCGRDYMQMWPSTVLVVACSASQSYTELEAWRRNHESSHVFPFSPQTRLAFMVRQL